MEDEPEFEYCRSSGLHVLEHGPSNPDVDIVAIHGLAADPVYTWIKKVTDADIKTERDRVGRLNKKGLREVMWLKHLLPASVPNARILKYNYASTYLRDAAKESLRSIAERLVNLLHDFRMKEENGVKRPLVFVGHSFGGVVIEEALVYAYRHEDQGLKHLTLSTCGVVFLGTPHRGSKASSWGIIVANTAAALRLDSHNRILKTLKTDSEVLERLLGEFTILARELRMKLICFYETKSTKLGKSAVFGKTLVVDKRSATIDCYMPRSLVSDHPGMNKFGSSTEENFIRVSSAIKELVEWSQKFLHIHRALNEVEPDGLLQQLPPPTIHFTGRDDHLEVMRQYFEIGTGNEIQKCKVFVLYGLAGSGKTQLALKFAEIHGNYFWKIFFVDASNVELLNFQLTNVARQFRAGETPKEALAWLCAQRKNWLLIFDNADDSSLNLRQYFPNECHGSIIITTRNMANIIYAPQSNVHMTNLSPRDAVDLLLKASMLELPCEEATILSARLLVRELGYLPLAIAQAGAYVRQNSTIEEYLDLFQKRRKELLSDVQNENNRPVYAAWDISYQQLDDSAKDFLRICAFLHNEGIPKTLFQRGIPRLLVSKYKGPAELEVWKRTLRAHWTSDGEWDVLKFNRTISQLTSYSLVHVTLSEQASLYSLHKLVHSWVRDSLDAEISRGIHITVMKLVCLSMDRGSSVSDYKSRRQLLAHAATISTADDLHPDEALQVAMMYSENGQWAKAENLQIQALQLLKRIRRVREGHPATLTCMSDLACTYFGQGRLGEAEKLLKGVLEARKRILGKEHPDMLASVNNLAMIYSEQGRLAEAEALQIEELELSKKLQDDSEEGPEILTSMNNLAMTYSKQGRLVEAEKLLKDVLDARKRILGEHPDTLASMNNLAMTYSEQGQSTEAEKLLKDVLEARKRILGEENPDTLTSINNLALTYSKQGRFAEAEELLKDVLETRQRIWGEEDPGTLTSISNLALTYTKQGRFIEAEELLKDVFEVRQRILGDEHPATLTSVSNLASTYSKQGRLVEAHKLYKDVLESRKRILGGRHYDTLMSITNLAMTYSELGQLAEAEDLLKKMHEGCKSIQGEEHPETLASMSNLAMTYSKQGRFAEAEGLLSSVLESRQRVLGKKHVTTLKSMHHLVKTFFKQGRLTEAEKLVNEVLEARKEILGEEHLTTLKSIHYLAKICFKRAQFIEAEKLLKDVLDARRRILGDEHPTTLKSMHYLAKTYFKQRRLMDAEKLLKDMLEARKTTLGEERLAMLKSMHYLAKTYFKQERYIEAGELVKVVLEARKQILGEEHPDTMRSIRLLQTTLRSCTQNDGNTSPKSLKFPKLRTE